MRWAERAKEVTYMIRYLFLVVEGGYTKQDLLVRDPFPQMIREETIRPGS